MAKKKWRISAQDKVLGHYAGRTPDAALRKCISRNQDYIDDIENTDFIMKRVGKYEPEFIFTVEDAYGLPQDKIDEWMANICEAFDQLQGKMEQATQSIQAMNALGGLFGGLASMAAAQDGMEGLPEGEMPELPPIDIPAELPSADNLPTVEDIAAIGDDIAHIIPAENVEIL